MRGGGAGETPTRLYNRENSRRNGSGIPFDSGRRTSREDRAPRCLFLCHAQQHADERGTRARAARASVEMTKKYSRGKTSESRVKATLQHYSARTPISPRKHFAKTLRVHREKCATQKSQSRVMVQVPRGSGGDAVRIVSRARAPPIHASRPPTLGRSSPPSPPPSGTPTRPPSRENPRRDSRWRRVGP